MIIRLLNKINIGFFFLPEGVGRVLRGVIVWGNSSFLG